MWAYSMLTWSQKETPAVCRGIYRLQQQSVSVVRVVDHVSDTHACKTFLLL